jgi:hypothetical protein
MSDLRIKDVKESVEESNKELAESLTNRFSQDLIASMVFFVFNAVCHNIDISNNYDVIDEEERCADKFFKEWSKAAKKQIKKELFEINKNLKTGTMAYLGAISSFSLPSTEDYQNIYNKALRNTEHLFRQNTSKNKK